MATLSLKDRSDLINTEIEAKSRNFSVTRLRKLYKISGIRYKKVKVRRCWRRPDDLKNLAKDV